MWFALHLVQKMNALFQAQTVSVASRKDYTVLMRTDLKAPGRKTDADLTDRLLRLALDALSEGGLNALNLDWLAKQAGTSKQAIYRRYASKEALAAAAIDAALDQLSPPPPERSNVARDLSRLLAAYRQSVFRAPVGRAALKMALGQARHAHKLRIDQELGFQLRQILIATPFERDMDARISVLIAVLWQEALSPSSAPATPAADLDVVIHLLLGLGPKAQ